MVLVKKSFEGSHQIYGKNMLSPLSSDQALVWRPVLSQTDAGKNDLVAGLAQTIQETDMSFLEEQYPRTVGKPPNQVSLLEGGIVSSPIWSSLEKLKGPNVAWS